MIKLNLKQGYLAMFYLLDEHYWESTRDESLGDVLSFLSPFTFIGGMSADPACWEEWQETVDKITSEDFITLDELLKSSIAFLERYSNDFFKIQWVINDLKKLSSDSGIWEKYVQKALEQRPFNK